MRKFSLFLSVVLLCFSAVTGAMFCLITAFQIPVQAAHLAVIFAAVSVFCACSVFFRRRWILYLCCFFAVSGIAWYFFPQITEGLSAAVYHITEEYSKAFDNISAIQMAENAGFLQATVFFAVLGGYLCILVCAYLQAAGLQWGAVIMTSPFLIASLIILQTEPAVWCQALLVGSYALIFLTSSLRNVSPQKSGTAVLLLSVPVAAILMALVFLISPREYTRSQWSDSLKEKISSAADRINIFQVDQETGDVRIVSPLTTGALGSRIWNRNMDKFDLSSIGPQRELDIHVMDVWCEESGTMYMRGSSMAVYEDNRWSVLPDEMYETFSVFPQQMQWAASYNKTIQVRTDRRAGIYYTPYDPTVLPEKAEIISDANVKNPLQEKEYRIDYADTVLRDEGYTDFVLANYLQVPEQTAKEIKALKLPLLEQPVFWAISEENVQKTADFVRNSAKYSLEASRMPEGKDFTAWFLSESETGYCVHYATAAAVLLRMQGIPSRFVTGYLIETEKNKWCEVTEKDAHAWVEYYTESGWKILDPTPAADYSENPAAATIQNENNRTDQNDPNEPDEKQNQSEEQDLEKGTKPVNKENQHDQNKSVQTNATKPDALQIILWILLAAVVLIGFWNLFVRLTRKQRLTRGTLRKRIIETYHEIETINGLCKEPIPEEILSIAQQARFSDHPANLQQINTMMQYYRTQREKLMMQTSGVKKLQYVVFKAL